MKLILVEAAENAVELHRKMDVVGFDRLFFDLFTSFVDT
jgi:hypothetical protein